MYLSIKDIEDGLKCHHQCLDTAKLVIKALENAGLRAGWITKDYETGVIRMRTGRYYGSDIICSTTSVTVRQKGSRQVYADHGWMEATTERHFEYVGNPGFDWSVFIDWIKKACYTVQVQSES